ncbi:DUF4226 domain-containing protein [Mycolicibacter senuensis]|uniref:DUF4226 domain-containing protein n=1 Tax=Mycolicibacter senuensis TaxID=386913 RepID=A0A7I9XNL3_9MYCO|nr:DUF4226 domain-containing protein [Mycolicibacter senuensis]ORW70315.1 hypothetical protein AWC24_04170 [Mycolicibacter senuensis]GFG71572.1 hypothetical protein MSEN_32920 [Mycolicibacter senuensis]
MATRDEVLDAIRRIEETGGAGEATRAAQAALTLPLPPDGYDRVLHRLAPADTQQGSAAQAMRTAESALAQQLSKAAEFDRQIIAALRHAHKTTLDGRRRLDNVQTEIVGATQHWDLSTAAGAREFQRFLIVKLGEIIGVVEEANDDDTSKQELTAALTALYAAPSAHRVDPAPVEQNPEPGGGPSPAPVAPSLAEAAPSFAEDGYLDSLPDEEPEDDYRISAQRPAAAPPMPAFPGFGGEGPGFGAMPPMAGLPPAGSLSGSGYGAEPADDEGPTDAATPADDDTFSDGGERDDDRDDAAAEPRQDGPVTVTLPDGATTTVVDPQLAAAMQAAADGTPVAEAFRRQGIDIPPAGTPVTSPVDQAQLQPGDIGVLTDRHALSVGNGKALLDGQLHLAANLRGPGFLGWQHPPVRIAEPITAGEPAPTRPAMSSGTPASLKIHVPTVIVD